MSKFFALEMAHEVARHPQLVTCNGFLGWGQKVVYRPTESPVESYSNYYSMEDAEKVRDLINCTDPSFDTQLGSCHDLPLKEFSTFRLDLCISHDSQFIAMQLNHVAEGKITHITPIRYFEGSQAEKVDDIF